jgi:hypothetical protein
MRFNIILRYRFFFLVYLATFCQWLRLYGVEGRGDTWIMNLNMWKEAVVVWFKKLSQHSFEGLRKTTKTSVSIASLRAEIWTRDLPATKQEC